MDEQAAKPKRTQQSKEEKRVLADQTTKYAQDHAESLRQTRDAKTARLRALRLASAGD